MKGYVTIINYQIMCQKYNARSGFKPAPLLNLIHDG